MKEYIKKLLHESLINEFISQDMISLKRYFTLTDDEILGYLPLDYCYLLKYFVDDEDIELELNDYEPCDVVEYIQKNNKELYDKFSKWLFNGIHHNSLPIESSEYPAWSFYGKPELIKNQWLIHFSNDVNGIEKHGFNYGVDEMGKLGLTTHLSSFDKK